MYWLMKAKPLTVKLAHRPNPDLFDRGGYWDEPAESGKTQAVPVNTYAEASKVCQDYIRRNSLGAGNWTGGNIYQGRTKVGHVSYNGRVWDIEGKEIK
jgi:hypothetical protein